MKTEPTKTLAYQTSNSDLPASIVIASENKRNASEKLCCTFSVPFMFMIFFPLVRGSLVLVEFLFTTPDILMIN